MTDRSTSTPPRSTLGRFARKVMEALDALHDIQFAAPWQARGTAKDCSRGCPAA